jgi:hypothetical protein
MPMYLVISKLINLPPNINSVYYNFLCPKCFALFRPSSEMICIYKLLILSNINRIFMTTILYTQLLIMNVFTGVTKVLNYIMHILNVQHLTGCRRSCVTSDIK